MHQHELRQELRVDKFAYDKPEINRGLRGEQPKEVQCI